MQGIVYARDNSGAVKFLLLKAILALAASCLLFMLLSGMPLPILVGAVLLPVALFAWDSAYANTAAFAEKYILTEKSLVIETPAPPAEKQRVEIPFSSIESIELYAGLNALTKLLVPSKQPQAFTLIGDKALAAFYDTVIVVWCRKGKTLNVTPEWREKAMRAAPKLAGDNFSYVLLLTPKNRDEFLQRARLLKKD